MKGLVTAILIGFYGQAMACVCAKTETVKESFEGYPLIFHGHVIDKSVVLYSTTLSDRQLRTVRERLKTDEKKLSRFEAEKILKVTFELIEIIKGDSITSTMTIFTSIDTSCDIDFKKNKDYLIYATREGFNDNKYLRHGDNNFDFIKERLYWTHLCTRTRLFNEKEKKELTELKNG